MMRLLKYKKIQPIDMTDELYRILQIGHFNLHAVALWTKDINVYLVFLPKIEWLFVVNFGERIFGQVRRLPRIEKLVEMCGNPLELDLVFGRGG